MWRLIRSAAPLPLVFPFGLLFFLFLCPLSFGYEKLQQLRPEELCADFSVRHFHPAGSSSLSPWTFENCLDVWKRFSSTVPNGLHIRSPLVDAWRETASELRRKGSPCLVASGSKSDGAGSTTIRHFAAWIFAREMGCDWVTPEWRKKHWDRGNGTTLYCHRTATADEMDWSKPHKELQALRRCAVVDWLTYFQFGVPSVDLPERGEMKIIQVSKGSTTSSWPLLWDHSVSGSVPYIPKSFNKDVTRR